jgi:hypothetical protein
MLLPWWLTQKGINQMAVCMHQNRPSLRADPRSLDS